METVPKDIRLDTMYRGSYGIRFLTGVILILNLATIRANAAYECLVDSVDAVIPSGALLEIELKYELRKRGYKELLAALSEHIVRETEYHSYYFDSKKSSLKKAGLNLRLRIAKQRAELTLKSSASLKSKGELPIKARWETDQRMTLDVAHRFANGELRIADYRGGIAQKIRREFPNVDLEKVKIFGSIPSHRTDVKLPSGLKLEIDEFVIGEQTYYEVEVEFSPGEEEAVHAEMSRLFKKHDIRWDFSPQSKRSRLLEWQKLN